MRNYVCLLWDRSLTVAALKVRVELAGRLAQAVQPYNAASDYSKVGRDRWARPELAGTGRYSSTSGDR